MSLKENIAQNNIKAVISYLSNLKSTDTGDGCFIIELSFLWGTALTAAIFLEKRDICKKLIAQEDSLGINKHPGALVWAVKRRNLDLIKLMSAQGIDLNSTTEDLFQEIDESYWQFTVDDDTPFSLNPNYFAFDLPLKIAMNMNNEDIVAFLLTQKVNLHTPGFMNQTPNDLLTTKENLSDPIKEKEHVAVGKNYHRIK